MSFLKVENIFKSFGKTEVLKGISFEMSAHSRLALIGKSGSGKSTMLRLIAGLEIPDSGIISLNSDGANIVLCSEKTYLKPEKRNIGYVFQNHSLFPHLDIYNNIVFGVGKMSKKEKLAIASEYLAMLGLEDKISSYPHQLSGGEKQRISIIRTLAAKPKLLLLDEPFSNLDKDTKEQLKSDLKLILEKEQLPTIMITHDAEDSFDLADEVILLETGKIVACGNPEELYKHPTNEHSARFFSDAEIITKSEANSQFFDRFNISANQIYLTPQNIRISDNGIEAKVLNQKFIGIGYLVTLDCLGTKVKIFSENKIKETVVKIVIEV